MDDWIKIVIEVFAEDLNEKIYIDGEDILSFRIAIFVKRDANSVKVSNGDEIYVQGNKVLWTSKWPGSEKDIELTRMSSSGVTGTGFIEDVSLNPKGLSVYRVTQ